MRFYLLICGLLIVFNQQTVFGQIFIPQAFWNCKDGYDYEITNTGTDFSTGTFSNTNVSGNSVVLSTGQSSGTFTSKVYDVFGGCSPLQSWTKFEWKTSLPFGKELPITSETATDYSGITTGLATSLQFLFHLNGTGSIANGATITAAAGSNATASNVNGTGMTYATGKLSTAVSLDGTDDAISVPYTQTSVSDYSVAAWIKTTTAGNGVFLQDRGGGAGSSLTLGIGNNPGGCAAGRISYGVDSNTIYIGKCTSSTYNSGNWQHVVGVWDGTSGTAVASSQFTIYVNGNAVSTTDTTVGSVSAPLTGLGNTKIGRHDAWSVNYAGLIDEVGVWTRALSATEAQQLYRRGANNIQFQIKTCDSSDCSDVATWKGPDNTSATSFSELNNNTNQNTFSGTVLTAYPSMVFANFPSLTVNTKRFFQYKAAFTTDDTSLQPDLSYTAIYHGCAASSVTYTAGGTFTLPKFCTQMTVTANGAGGAAARSTGGGNKSAGGAGGLAVKTFTSLTPLSQFSIQIATGGACAQTAGTGAYAGGAGGSNASGSAGSGTAGYGGTGGTGSTYNGGTGLFGGGGGGDGGASNVGAGGGGATSLSYLGADWVVAGGGGASGGVQNGTAGAGGGACGGVVSGDYTTGSNGGGGSGANRGGGGGGGACYCLGGCTSASAGGGAGGDNAGNACQTSNNGANGSLTITYQ